MPFCGIVIPNPGMWFNSFEFLEFFLVAFALYWIIPRWRGRKLFLLAASYYFYACWNPPFVVLLLISSTIDYLVGRALAASESARRRKMLVSVSCITNFGILAAFKYPAFLLGTWHSLIPGGNDAMPLWVSRIVLPVGISFYTFHGVSYILDVYRGKIEAKRSVVDFFLFVSFFPQLVAGPILRAASFVPQLESRRRWDVDAALSACYLIILGLFQKIALADNLAPLANLVFDESANFNGGDLWLGTYSFAFQIYFDFAGYSNIAIGTARLLGFDIPENFRMPYIAVGFRDFWRRWHISLSSWFRDYLYIPLGGNRGSAWRTRWNLFVVMTVCGLWHGANWTFVVWGGLHCVYLTVEHELTPFFDRLPETIRTSRLAEIAAAILTFHLTCIAWVFFRADSVSAGASMITRMVAADSWLPTFEPTLLVYVAASMVVLGVALLFADRASVQTIPSWAWGVSAGLMLILALMTWADSNEFIYFQF